MLDGCFESSSTIDPRICQLRSGANGLRLIPSTPEGGGGLGGSGGFGGGVGTVGGFGGFGGGGLSFIVCKPSYTPSRSPCPFIAGLSLMVGALRIRFLTQKRGGLVRAAPPFVKSQPLRLLKSPPPVEDAGLDVYGGQPLGKWNSQSFLSRHRALWCFLTNSGRETR